MVPLALPEGKHARNPQDRERRTIKVSPEAVMATTAGVSRTPRLSSGLGRSLKQEVSHEHTYCVH